MNEKIKQLKEKREQIQLELQTESKKIFEEEVAKIFVEFPEITSFTWTQYTPYFNDGDSCTFSAHTFDFRINDGLTEYDFRKDKYDGKGNQIPNPNYQPRLLEGYIKIREILQSLDDEFYQTTFNDHVKVTVTAKGATTEDYQHD